MRLRNCDESNADNMMAVKDATTLKDMLLSKGLDKKRLHFTVDGCATHTEKSWAGRFPGDILFLFKKNL